MKRRSQPVRKVSKNRRKWTRVREHVNERGEVTERETKPLGEWKATATPPAQAKRKARARSKQAKVSRKANR